MISGMSRKETANTEFSGTPAEILDVVDRDGNPTGETVDREKAHREGLLTGPPMCGSSAKAGPSPVVSRSCSR